MEPLGGFFVKKGESKGRSQRRWFRLLPDLKEIRSELPHPIPAFPRSNRVPPAPPAYCAAARLRRCGCWQMSRGHPCPPFPTHPAANRGRSGPDIFCWHRYYTGEDEKTQKGTIELKTCSAVRCCRRPAISPPAPPLTGPPILGHRAEQGAAHQVQGPDMGACRRLWRTDQLVSPPSHHAPSLLALTAAQLGEHPQGSSARHHRVRAFGGGQGRGHLGAVGGCRGDQGGESRGQQTAARLPRGDSAALFAGRAVRRPIQPVSGGPPPLAPAPPAHRQAR